MQTPTCCEIMRCYVPRPAINAIKRAKTESTEELFESHIDFYSILMKKQDNAQTSSNQKTASRQTIQTSNKGNINIKPETTLKTEKKQSLRSLHQNIDGFTSKIELIKNTLNTNPDIVILTEHGLSQANLINTVLHGL